MRTTATIHNPMLKLVAAKRIQALPPEARGALRAFLIEFRDVCRAKGDLEWKRNKFWNATYYKVMGVYALHLARLCREPMPNPPLENTGETGNAWAASAMTGPLPVADAPTISTPN